MSKRWLALLLFGMWIGRGGVAHAAPVTLTVSPDPLAFGSVVVNQPSTMNTTLSGSNGTSVTVTLALEAGGDCSQFQIVSPTTPVVINNGTNQTIMMTFTPTSTGSKSCTIDVNDGGGTIKTFTATGTGTAPTPATISVDNNALSFGNIDVGSTSATKSVTATNTGDATLTISSATFTTGGSDYTVSGPSTATLAHNATATWNIACKPSVQGPRSGTFEIASNASNTPTFDVSLTCTGDHAALVVDPTSVSFGLVQRGTTQSAAFTLSNAGNVDVTGIVGAVSPTGKGYTIDPATPVPTTLAAGGSVMLNVKFAPTTNSDGGAAAITFTGAWKTTHTAVGTLALSGTSASVNVTPTTPLDFGNFRFDSAPTQTYHIANDGGANITIMAADFVPNTGTASTEITFTIKKGTSTVTLPQTLTPTQQLDVTATARPNNRTGLVSGHIDVITNITAPVTPRVMLTGNATAAAVMATPMADFGAVDVDATAPPTQTVTLKNTGDATLNYSIAPMNGGSTAFTFTGLPSGGATLASGTQIDITVTYKPTLERPAGNSEIAVLVASLTGVLGGPSTSMISIQGRGIDRHLMVDPAPSFPPTYRNPGDKAPLRNVTVHNTGEATLQITAAMISNAPGMTLVDTSPVTITGGGSHDFVVKFAPTTVGTVTGQLVLTNNDNARPMAMVTLTGVAMDRNIQFGPGMINLGFTGVGVPITVTGILAVTNMNPNDGFKIHQITLDDDSVFHIDSAPSDAALPSGSTQTFSITFTPTSINHFQTIAHLHIDQDPNDEGGMDVQISGDAVFADAHGSGGCNAGGAGSGGGLVLGLAALVLRRRRRRRRLPAVALVAAGATLALSPAAHSDDIGITVFEPTPATTGAGFALQAPDVGASGSWVMNAVASYASNPLVLDSRTGTGAITNALVARSTLMQLGAAYALLDRFELGAHIPLYQQSGEQGAIDRTGKPASGTATGNLAVHAKARLWRGSLGLGTLVAGASASVVFPTASKGQFTGSGQMEERFLALGSFTPAALESRLTISVNAGPMLRGTSRYANIVEKSGVAWGAGASYRILDELWATAELFGESTPSGKGQQPVGSTMPPAITLSPIEALAGLSIRPDRRVVLGLAIGRGVTDAVGTPDLRGVLSLSVVPGGTLAPIRPAGPDRPDGDADGDGIPDSVDKCPNEPEDKDGFEDLDGCPDPDNDHDGIPDNKDKCPNAPETINGFQDEDGCPDKGDSTIVLSPDRIETLDPIQFNGVKLTKADNPLLEQVAATLRAHGEIVRLRVTVHVQPTDDQDADQAKSDKRAQAVRDWLVQWGIAPARLEARGFGGAKPLVPPEQRGAAKINDRLELIILERK